MHKILIVEDESLVALEISNFVISLGYDVVETATNANQAVEIFKNNNIDVVLMDVYLKGDIDGTECANTIKEIKETPVIFISAFSDDLTLQRAIDSNPTSYLVKPFNRKELKVALLIATKTTDSQTYKGDVIFDNEFSFDTINQELICKGEIIHLTKREKQLLRLFVINKNNVVSFYDLEIELWPDKEANENTRRALISKLRSKLNYKFIETIHSLGYKINI